MTQYESTIKYSKEPEGRIRLIPTHAVREEKLQPTVHILTFVLVRLED